MSDRGLAVRLRGVVHLYRRHGTDVVALRGVDLGVASGEMVVLLGPSGMGKTTVMRLVAGLMTPSAGTVHVGDFQLDRMSPSQRRALRGAQIGYVAQGTSPNLLPYATAAQNLWFAQHGARTRGAAPPWSPEELLAELGLGAIADQTVARLARGQQQQVAVACGVACGPGLLLADEPTSQLGGSAPSAVIDLLHKVNRGLGTTVMIVTHDREVAAKFPRTVVIRDGRVGSEGRHGEEYAVVDGVGSVQLPLDMLEIVPPNSRVKVVRTERGVELRPVDPDR
jgi:putative ABC transport system ATP-binding protein